jgi:hypothetical protein
MLNEMAIEQYGKAIDDFMEERKMWLEKDQAYKNLVEEVKPAWYDKFYIGALCSTLVITIILFLHN